MQELITTDDSTSLSEGSSLFLDALRGCSAQAVVVGHAISGFQIFKFAHQPNAPWMQNIAVLIFFILSGFLISYSTFYKISNQGDYSFKRFFIDRFSRIYTAFIPSLVFVLLVDLFIINVKPSSYTHTAAFNLKTFLGNLLMLQDFPRVLPISSITSFGSGRPFWTLAIEWWIYMFFGYFTIELVYKKRYSLINWAIIIFLSIVPFKNLYGGRGNGLTVTWIFGALIYLAFKSNLLKKASTSTKLFTLCLILTSAVERIGRTRIEYDALFAFLVATVIYILIDLFQNFSFKPYFQKIIRMNANCSYTLYLIHYSVVEATMILASPSFNPYLKFLIAFTISNIVALIMGHLFEDRFTKKVKAKLYYLLKVNKTI